MPNTTGPEADRGNGTPLLNLFREQTDWSTTPERWIRIFLLTSTLCMVLVAGCDFGGERFSPSTPTRIAPTSTLPPATETESAPASGSTATTGPGATSSPTATGMVLPVSVASTPTDLPDYDRSTWRHWTDEDGDCQNARQEVLITESSVAVTFQPEEQCRVATGLWEGPYTGTIVDDPGDLDVDHMVPLGNAHQSGGWSWSPERKREYANYMGYDNHLIATTSGANRSKGSKGPDRWRPPLQDYWCVYAVDWVSIKNEWGLTVTEDEYIALSEMLATCETTILLQPTQGTPPAPPTPTVPPSLPTDLRYDPFGPDRDCGDFDSYEEALAFFLAAGGPQNDRHRLDVNGDGRPCETLPGGPSAARPQDGNDGLAAPDTHGGYSVATDDTECADTGPPQSSAFARGPARVECQPAPPPAAAIPASPLPATLPTPSSTPSPTIEPTPTPETTPAAIAPKPQPEATADVSCGNFSSWPEAQEVFLSSGGPGSDPHGLDGNDDGVACPHLPGAPALQAGNRPSASNPEIALTPGSPQESTPVIPAFVDLPFDPDGPDRNCGDFVSWWEAQNFYLASGGPMSDPHRLDQNGDGTACESLFEDTGDQTNPSDPAPVAPSTSDDFEDRNCSDFATWQEANTFFVAEGGPHEDPHRLDRNADGIPCQSLPGARKADSGDGQPNTQTPPPATETPAEDAVFQDRNCSDFETWEEADTFFRSEGGPSQDPHRLDRNADGIPCQSLPGAPDG